MGKLRWNGRLKFQITANNYVMYDMDYKFNEPLETISGETKNEFYKMKII